MSIYSPIYSSFCIQVGEVSTLEADLFPLLSNRNVMSMQRQVWLSGSHEQSYVRVFNMIIELILQPKHPGLLSIIPHSLTHSLQWLSLPSVHLTCLQRQVSLDTTDKCVRSAMFSYLTKNYLNKYQYFSYKMYLLVVLNGASPDTCRPDYICVRSKIPFKTLIHKQMLLLSCIRKLQFFSNIHV